jgi:hypothetical protein
MRLRTALGDVGLDLLLLWFLPLLLVVDLPFVLLEALLLAWFPLGASGFALLPVSLG